MEKVPISIDNEARQAVADSDGFTLYKLAQNPSYLVQLDSNNRRKLILPNHSPIKLVAGDTFVSAESFDSNAVAFQNTVDQIEAPFKTAIADLQAKVAALEAEIGAQKTAKVAPPVVAPEPPAAPPAVH